MKPHLTRSIVGKFVMLAAFALPLGFASLISAQAGEADVVSARAELQSGKWRFDVTVRHDDTGWDHYADKWDVVGSDGTVYGTRVLAHPHENEQPFTRSLAGVDIPGTVSEVVLRAHDSVHGYGGKEFTVILPR